MRRFGFLFAAAAALVGGNASDALAQASCPIEGATTKTATTYTLTNNDQCSVLVFTARTVVTVTAPAATTVPPGFQAMLISTGGGIVINTGSPFNATGATTTAVGPGQSAVLLGDGRKYELGVGTGFSMTVPASVNFTNYSGVFPGTVTTNSPNVVVPDGTLQFTNRASWPSFSNTQRGYSFADVCRFLPDAVGLAPGRLQFLRVLDPMQRPRMMPVCG